METKIYECNTSHKRCHSLRKRDFWLSGIANDISLGTCQYCLFFMPYSVAFKLHYPLVNLIQTTTKSRWFQWTFQSNDLVNHVNLFDFSKLKTVQYTVQ